MSLEGIDISNWQKNSWKADIDIYGKDLVIARATFDYQVDPLCDKIIQYAKTQNKMIGVYFFPLTASSDPEASASWCVDQVKGYIGDTMFLLDWESYKTGHNVGNTDWALRWLIEFEKKSGVKPLIYMNQHCEKSYDFSKIVANGNGLWIANYGSNTGINHGFSALKHWKSAAMHQYTSNKRSGGLDADVFFGDRSAWLQYCQPKGESENYPPVATTIDDRIFRVGDRVSLKKLIDEKGTWLKPMPNGVTIYQITGNRVVLKSDDGDIYCATNLNNLEKM